MRAIVVITAFLTLAAAAPGKRLEADHAAVIVPSAWTANSTAGALLAKNLLAMSKLASSEAQVYADARAGVFGIFVTMTGTQPVAHVRLELETFVDGVRKSFEGAGWKASRAERSETKTRMALRWDTRQSAVDLATLTSAVVDAHGTMHAYLVACVRTGDAKNKPKIAEKATAECEAMLHSFELTWKDGELKPLESK